jgi:hypothetical protein
VELQCHRRYVFLAAVVTSLVAPAAGPAEQNGDVSGKRGTTVTIVEPSRFDWGDAGVGAAGAFGLTALVGGAVIALRGR